MAEANEEANRNTECSSRISCVFFPVSFSTKEFPDFITKSDNHIKDVIKTASDNHDLVEFWIWSFPKKIRTHCKHKEQVGDNRWYPGLLTAMNAGKYFRLKSSGVGSPMHKIRGDILATAAMLFLLAVVLWFGP